MIFMKKDRKVYGTYKSTISSNKAYNRNEAIPLKSIENNRINIGFLLPVPPSKTGLTNQLEWIRTYSNTGKLTPIIFTDTDKPYPIDNLKVEGIALGIGFPFSIVKKAKKFTVRLLHIQYNYGYLGFGRGALPVTSTSLFNLLSTILLSNLFGIKTVVTLHSVLSEDSLPDNVYPSMQRLFYRLNKIYGKLLLRATNRIVVFSRQQSEALGESKSLDKICVIPHFVSPMSIQKRIHEKFTFTFHGYLRPSKGIDDLLDAYLKLFGQFPETTLIIAGGKHSSALSRFNDEELFLEQLRDRIRRLQSRCSIEFYEGFLTEQQLNDIFLRTDVIVLPYTDRGVEVSGVVSRVLDLRIPLICSQTPRFQSELEDGVTALFFEPRNVSMLYEKMALLLSDSNLRESLAKNLEKKISGRYPNKIAKMHEKLYFEILGIDSN